QPTRLPVALNAQARHGRAATADAQIVEGLRIRVDVAQLDVDTLLRKEVAHQRAVRATRKVVQRVAFSHRSASGAFAIMPTAACTGERLAALRSIATLLRQSNAWSAS